MLSLDPNHPLRESVISEAVPREWTLAEVARCIGGVLISVDAQLAPLDHPLGAVQIDTRLVSPSDIFVALRGSQTHGIEHAAEAAGAGAIAIVVGSDTTDQQQKRAMRMLPLLVLDVDSLVGIGRIARAWRRFNDPLVVGITGSSGKTSTKDLLAGILGGMRVHSSVENQNNELGVPLTLLNASADTDVVICEMGMRGHHQIDYLCSVAEPDIAVITNAGLAHVERLGTADDIVSAKSEIIAGLRPGGTSVTPAAQPELLAAVNEYSKDQDRAVIPRTDLTFHLHQMGIDEWALAVPGPHQQSNLAAALVVAREICKRRGCSMPDPHDLPLTISAGRGEHIQAANGIVVIDDSYNANPDSVRAALSALAQIQPTRSGGRRIAVLGLMAELGDHGPELHRAIGDFLVSSQSADIVVLVGDDPLVDHIATGIRGAAEEGTEPVMLYRSPSTDDAATMIGTIVRSGDVVLVKASRSVRLEGVVHALIEPGESVEGTLT